MGYHKNQIKKGCLGEVSKITEEYEEFIDADEQAISVMKLIELSDLIGAIEAHSVKYYNISLVDLIAMNRATQSAFEDGHRK